MKTPPRHSGYPKTRFVEEHGFAERRTPGQVAEIGIDSIRHEVDPEMAARLNARLEQIRRSGETPRLFDELFMKTVGSELSHIFTKPWIMGEAYDRLATPRRSELHYGGHKFPNIRYYTPRPESHETYIGYQPHGSERPQNAHPELLAINMLTKHGSFYLKGESTVGVGADLIRFDMYGTGLKMTIPAENFRMEIKRKMDELSKTNEALWFHAGHGSDEREIIIPGKVIKLGEQPVEKTIETLFSRVVPRGRYLIEQTMHIPPYNGKAWEIRHIIQCPNGIPQVTAKYAKVGKDIKFANIFLGGHPEKPESVVEAVMKKSHHEALSRAPHTIATIFAQIFGKPLPPEPPTAMDYDPIFKLSESGAKNRTTDFLKQSERIAIRSTEVLTGIMRGAIGRSRAQMTGAGGFHSGYIYPRILAVDITGTNDIIGRMIPAVVEIQYPIGYNSYVPELEQIDQKALARIKTVNREMALRDKRVIHMFLNPK
ncbi:MAG: hypothetical protein HY544_04750 [Candidatus Diapherotrites archaeon]|uniref:Uncharacterized protein n=1 Tax=Candidatus Iainarchaeum sp. TaxID=3101447 RepID=A0A8T3YM71_9ARCH|nr:hypothetical protein [Candidatus Diapherotrites archaeon]